MNWYQKYAGKTYRDRGARQNVTLWHVSPDRLGVLSPRSSFAGKAGMYLSQNYTSLIQDWTYYVKSKKHKNHPLDQKWDKLWREYETFEDLVDSGKATESQERDMVALREKIESMRDSIDSEEHRDAMREGYKTFFIHKISCPKATYDKAYKEMLGVYEKIQNGGNDAFWSWGKQVFIPEELLRECNIIGVKKLTDKDVDREYRDMNRTRFDHMEWKRELDQA